MKTFSKILIEWLKRLTIYLEKKLYKSNPSNPVSINSLAPKILTTEKEIDTIRPYLNHLKLAIDSKQINNIALTGSYGSGKSTILRTFQHLHPEYEYLNISLASFKDNKQQRKKDDSDFERKLEVSILQQMFYHVKPTQIPDSRFKRIVNLTSKKLFLLCAFVMLWSISALYLFKFDYIQKINPRQWDYHHPIDWIAVLISLVFFLGTSLLIKDIYRVFRNSKINKLSIKGELELEANDKSVFNQHLEEILYFFERTKFTVVVIEDVDRFESTDIFTKLREINILINNSSLIKRSVKFIYAIKDEMFNDKNERVKFFEFIIPIIPFINPSNASDQLAKLINEANLQNTLSRDFTSDVITFIDDIDMRLLINIFHEYQLYKTILSNELSQDNLFAMIVYKNLYPHDFGELQKRRGNLYAFFQNKRNYIETIIAGYKERIKKLEEELSIVEGETTKTVKELRAIYIVKIISKIGNFRNFYINYSQVNAWDILEDNHFNALKTLSNIQYTHQNGSTYDSGISLKSVEKEISKTLTYEDRERLVNDKAKNRTNLLKNETESIKGKINEIGLMSIKELFEAISTEKQLGHFNDNNLMRSLLLNGYIDEHYDDYISLFHGVNITKEDFAFERKVKSGHSLSFDYGISKIENLVKRIPDKYFKKEEILNYQLATFLLKNEIKNKTKFNYFFSILSIDGEKQFEFITGFIGTHPDEVGPFVKTICNHKPSFWHYIKTKSGFPENQILDLLRYIFEYAHIDTILKLKELESLNEFLEETPSIFSFCASLKNTSTLEKYIAKQSLRFKALDSPSAEQKVIFEFIYSNNYYHINEHNITCIVRVKEPSTNLDELNYSNYTTINKLKLQSLKEYLDNNIGEYIENIMIQQGNTRESEAIVIDILNRESIELELKEKVLNSQEVKIQSINDIEEVAVKRLVISSNKIVINWKNVFDYFDSDENATELDDTLINLLNSPENSSTLSKRKLSSVSNRDEEYIKKMSSLILHGRGLTIDAYTKLLDSLPYVYNSISYDQFDNDKIEKLLTKKILTLTPANHKGLKAKNRKFSNRLIETHQTDFLKTYSIIAMDSPDWDLIFQSSAITLQNKLHLIKNIDDSVIINSHIIANIVGDILPNDSIVPLRFEVLMAIFKANNSINKRINLLMLHWSNLDDSQVQSLVEILGDSYAKVFIKQHKPVFPSNSSHIELFTKLKERDLILRFEEKEKDKEQVIKVYAKYSDADEN